jgi:F-type H+-transporting ATPase subunit epsilon
MEVHLVAPEREVWGGRAQMVIADGVEGRVGILPGHAPMLIRLAVAPMRIQDEGGDWVWAVVDGGFLHVTSGEEGSRIDVLATSAEMAADIDAAAARSRVEELQRRLADHAEADLAGELARAQARANLGS